MCVNCYNEPAEKYVVIDVFSSSYLDVKSSYSNISYKYLNFK